MKWFVLLIVGSIISINAFGDLVPDNGIQSLPKTDRLRKLKESINEIEEVKKSKTLSDSQKHNIVPPSFQSVASDESMIGDVFGAIHSYEKSNKYWEEKNLQKTHASSTFDSGEALITENIQIQISESIVEDAIETIVKEAKKRQVVILNEAHHVPMHRAFAMQLARELKKIGYEYLACEAFTNVESTPPLVKGYVSDDTGIYTSEPMYANFLRESIRAHWKFISYEPNEGPREYYMAKNLVDRIFKKKPKAKVFIYVGYAHANKLPVSTDEHDHSMMAAQLKKMTGIDPLTIDQTTLFQQYNNKIQYAIYNEILKSHQIEKPSVLLTPQGDFLKLGLNSVPSETYNIQIIYPIFQNDPDTGRASWLESMAGFRSASIPFGLIPKRGKRLVYVYYLG